ncbi:MAG: hypothetical protein OEZ39_12090 [Gammaproteobacteria bacterium]|nr:hypothetical protein [Gammaproteobacteria bacterium]MDH5652584.1 hypothetical protein [Gammaproteobacteria bacterium]
MKYLVLALILVSANTYADSFTDNSYKGVKVGMSVAEAMKILTNYKNTQADYEPGGSCYYLEAKEARQSPAFMILNGKVARIDNYGDKSVTTREGVGIGSSKADVLKAYQTVTVEPHPYMTPEGEYLIIRLKNGLGIIFETHHDIVTSFRLGDESIRYIEGCA